MTTHADGPSTAPSASPSRPDQRGVLVDASRSQTIRCRPGERFHEVFEERCDAEAAGDAWPRGSGARGVPAVDDGGQLWSAGDLDARANRVARHLRALGVRAGDRVGLLFDAAVPAYAAMLAVSKLHAAFVPLDLAFPLDRVRYICADAGVRWVLSTSTVRSRHPELRDVLVCLDAPDVDGLDGTRLAGVEAGAPVDDLAYVVYTSGSTGRPKGVAVEHASICNFVRVAAEVYGYVPGDRVYQGMTIAFDFSVEEIWVPLAAGATLVPRPAGGALLGADLGAFLAERGVTALCCVPTLLATVEDDLPDLRFLLVSGEACPQDLMARWHRPGRRFLNVYGPTEATVTATWAVVDPAAPPTIGVPLPTYSVAVLHPDRAEALPVGELGEIAVAGVGLARGYVGRDDLTAKAFVPDVVGMPNNPSGRIYRTGDLGRITADGQVQYAGRIDTQVKVRGYRIELTEIESVLLQEPGVAAAVVSTYSPEPGVVELVAYYSERRDGRGVDPAALRDRLRTQLPPYMVPAYYERLAAIPMLPSDKADRKALPPPSGPRSGASDAPVVAASSTLEEGLAAALAGVLGLPRVSVEAHFFDDLGSNSLLLARFCAAARRAGLPGIAMQDVYQHPSVRRLAAALGVDAVRAPGADDGSAAGVDHRPARVVSSRRYAAFGALQLAVFLAYGYLVAVPVLSGLQYVTDATGLVDSYLRAASVGFVGFLALGAAPVAAKWLLIGRWTAREIPLWSLAHLRFWTVQTLVRTSPFVRFAGSPLYALYLRALGARIGRGTAVFAPPPTCADLLTVGDGAVVRSGAAMACYRAIDGRIETGPVTIGRDAFVGEKTVLDIGTTMGERTQLGHSSSLHTGQRIPDGEHWHGTPARRADPGTDYLTVGPVRCTTARRAVYSVLQMLQLVLVVLPLGAGAVEVVVLPYFEAARSAAGTGALLVDAALLSGVVFLVPVIGNGLVVLTVPRLLHRTLTPYRTYPLYGFHYAVQRTITRMTNNRFLLFLTGDSSYIVHYLKLLGYDLGKVVQSGSNFGVELRQETPFLSRVGSGTMVSDGLQLINADFSSSSFRVVPAGLGERNFLGNDIAVPPGARVGDNVLLATKVMVPIDGAVRHDVGLLGSPSFEIPRSVERDRRFDHLKTGEEHRRRLAAKNRHNLGTIGLFLLVSWSYVLASMLLGLLAVRMFDVLGAFAVVLWTLLSMVSMTLLSVLAERAAGGFRSLSPRFCSIYDPYFWWHERLWKLNASAPFAGTPFRPLVWRLVGVRMGRRVFDDGCSIVEATLLTVGDDCTLNAGSVLQCHSLEDGTFKSDRTRVGARCTLGPAAFVHYGVTVHEDAVLTADAFLMKGQEVPAGDRWGGNPARPLTSRPGPSGAAVVPRQGQGGVRWAPTE